jgi:dCTP deaminase
MTHDPRPRTPAPTPPLFPDLPSSSPAEDEAPETFTTGVLPSQRIRALIERHHLSASTPFLDEQVQPASVDLRLGPVAYRVPASFLPGPGATVRKRIEEFKSYELDLTGSAVLERGCVYIVPLLEELSLPRDYSAKANPKSTIGRLDVFVRLITDHASAFEAVPPGYQGRLYLEIVPRTFSVRVREGTRMSQLRFWRGNPLPSDRRLSALHASETLVYLADAPGEAQIAAGLWVSVDLQGAGPGDVIGYRAKTHAPLVDLALVDHYDPAEFWEPLHATDRRQLVLEPDEFHILASRERVRIPPGYAAEMVGYDPSVGEFRVHYAGFFDPGFGYGADDVKGTRAVLEVRSHEVPFLLEDGQRVARLVFERLQAVPDRIYGAAIGSSYQHQGLALSKYFRRPTPGRP